MEFDSNKAIFLQIGDAICERILSGDLKPEDRIPSVREYGASIGVNPNTVMRTYEKLTDQGIIYNKRGIGYFISPDAKDIVLDAERREFLENELPNVIKKIELLGLSPKELLSEDKQYMKTIMKHSFKILAITAFALIASSCYFKVPKNGGDKSIFGFTRGDGNVIDKEYVVEPFDKIHNEAALDIRFAQDSSTMVRIHADSNIVELLDVSVEDGTLTIKTEANNLIFEGESYIYVACPSIKEVHGSGSGDFDMQDFRLDTLALSFSGSGDIFLKDGSVNWLSISTSGSGDIKMDGINGKDVKCETGRFRRHLDKRRSEEFKSSDGRLRRH
jgi:DNA-binding transcriptional regulator YhcF (GntR family)